MKVTQNISKWNEHVTIYQPITLVVLQCTNTLPPEKKIFKSNSEKPRQYEYGLQPQIEKTGGESS